MVLKFRQFIRGESEGSRVVTDEVLGFTGLFNISTVEEGSGGCRQSLP